MYTDEDADEVGHEQILEAVLLYLLSAEAGADLEQVCAEAGSHALYDADGQPVDIRSVLTYHAAQVLTLDRGVLLELSDGSRFAVTIQVAERPRTPTHTRRPS